MGERQGRKGKKTFFVLGSWFFVQCMRFALTNKKRAKGQGKGRKTFFVLGSLFFVQCSRFARANLRAPHFRAAFKLDERSDSAFRDTLNTSFTIY